VVDALAQLIAASILYRESTLLISLLGKKIMAPEEVMNRRFDLDVYACVGSFS